jgi:predicted nucleotidyltransferase
MRFGLTESTIGKINAVFSTFPKVNTVIIYGSRAKGNYKHGSDIDLAMTGDQLDLKSQLEISIQLDDLLLPYLIDLSIYNQISNSDLVEHIQRVGQVFYFKKN